MRTLNTVTLIGRLVAAPRVETFGRGTLRAHLSVRTVNTFSRDGRECVATHTVPVVAYGDVAADCSHLRRGQVVLITGHISTSDLLDRLDRPRYVEVCASRVSGLCGTGQAEDPARRVEE